MRIAVAFSVACTILVLALALLGMGATAQSMPSFPYWCHQNGMFYQANLVTDSNNCGGCGLICPAGIPCKAGKCVDSVCSSAKRRLINVNQNLSDKKAFHTIQAAVDAANPCDTIHVAPGIYKENVKIDKSLAIGGSGEPWTAVDGNQVGSVFEIGSTNHGIKVTLSDIKIQNGLNVNNGGGILNGGILLLWRCNVTGNKAKEGGGAYNNGPGNLMVLNSTISGNTATDCGGGIFNWASLTVSGASSKINGNIASNSGGGIYNWGNAAVSGSHISRNVASSGNGGGLLNWGDMTLTSNSISLNMARNGGGISNAMSGNSPGTLTMKDCTIIGNSASGTPGSSGGGIYNLAKATIDSCAIGPKHVIRGSGNVAGFGGGICSFGSGAILTVTHSTVSWNRATASDGGGGIYSQAAQLVCDARQVYSNSPDDIKEI